MRLSLQLPGLQRTCSVAYEIGLVLAALLLLLALLHRPAVWHADVERIVDARHIAVTYPNAAGLRADQTVPIYRFSGDWRMAIGQARVESVDGQTVLLSFDPGAMRWPMGRQGLVTAQHGDLVEIGLGRQLGLRPGDRLNLFRDRKRVGGVVLTELGEQTSKGRLTGDGKLAATGLLASEFTVSTQAVFDQHSWLSAFELASVMLLLCIYLAVLIGQRRSPLLILGEHMMPGLRRLLTPGVRRLLQLGAGMAWVWVSVTFAVYLLDWLAHLLPQTWALIEPIRLAISMPAMLKDKLVWLYGIGALSYLALMWQTRSSPLQLAWQRLEFSGGIYRWMQAGIRRDAVIWLLHGVIAFAFARTLLGFVQGNLSHALHIAWPHSGTLLTGMRDSDYAGRLLSATGSIGATIAHMLTHRPQFDSIESLHLTVRYLLWTLTIIGCLIGYGHSILGFLWGKRIRNLDFTLTGWISNAVCYGPLLGAVFWQMLPALVGPDPIFASGAIGYLAMGVETYLNLIYMLTIWNLGTMFGVMTDKGVRRSGFYAVVRHPSYTMEVLMFLALELRGLSGPAQWFAASMLVAIYWLRSEREDAFMRRSNPQYTAYQNTTPYKFIPGIY